jgi:hypothetical protein
VDAPEDCFCCVVTSAQACLQSNQDWAPPLVTINGGTQLAGGIETYRFGRRLSKGRALSSSAARPCKVASSPKRPTNWVPIGGPAAFQRSGKLIGLRVPMLVLIAARGVGSPVVGMSLPSVSADC